MIYYLLIIIGFLSRFIPGIANFTAVGSIALFSGYYLKDKRKALLIPLTIMLITDYFIGFYDPMLLFSVYLSFGLVVLLGSTIKNKKWYFSLPTSILGTIIFFIITNWAFWQFTGFYPLTMEGLISCYVAAIPFLKNSFMGDFFYTLIFFSLAEMAVNLKKKLVNLRPE